VTASASSPHVSAKRQRRRTEILHAALRAFRDGGYHATTLDGHRRAARHPEDRPLPLLPRQGSDPLRLPPGVAWRSWTGSWPGPARFDTPAERLAHVIREHVRVMTDTLEASPLAFEVTALSPERQKRGDRRARPVRAGAAADDPGGHRGRPLPRRSNPKTAVFAILGAINWIARWYRPEGALRADELGREFADHLMGGLTCR
jgi:hypothetical protein